MAVELQLWQDAFKSVEDIQKLREESGRSVPGRLLLTYYAHLTHVFAQSEDHLYRLVFLQWFLVGLVMCVVLVGSFSAFVAVGLLCW